MKTVAAFRTLASICMITGLLLILYPRIEYLFFEKKQDEVLALWEEQRQITNQLEVVPTTTESSNTNTRPEIPIMIGDKEVVGVISIDKINLQSPIVKGAEEQSLQVGIGVVELNRRPGDANNFVLAGHNSTTYGKHFDRLEELEIDDVILVSTSSDEYKYKVTSITVVNEDDLSVLENSLQPEITLITCEYDRKNKPIYRLIVKGTLLT